MKKLLNFKKFIFLFVVFVTLSITYIVTHYLLNGMVNNVEMTLYDHLARLSADNMLALNEQSKASDDIVILAIDNDSQKLEKDLNIGRWPWPRSVWSDVIDFVSKGAPKCIVFDIRFEGKEGNSSDNIKSDTKFANAIKNHKKNIILAFLLRKQKIFSDNKYIDFIPLRHDLILKIEDSDLYKSKDYKNKILDYITYLDYHPLWDEFIENTKYIGATNQVQSNNDSIIRSHRPLYTLANSKVAAYVPSLPLAAVLAVLPDEEKKPFKLMHDRIILGKRVIQLDNEGKFFINWHGEHSKHNTYKFIPISKVLDKSQRILPDEFKNKIVVIGRTQNGSDIHATSMAMNYVGPEIMATCIDNILNDTDTTNKFRRKFITKAGLISQSLIILLFCLVTGLFIRKASSNFYSFIWLVFIVLAYMLAAVASFAFLRYWISIVYPLIFIISTAMTVYLYKLHISNKQKNEIKELFGRFVSPQVLDKLLLDPSVISKEGDRKVLTVLFSDIRGFTTLSEHLPANELLSQLNEYFNEVYEVVIKHGGTFDKYIGDAVMAFYGDPLPVENHALQAVLTAIDMIKLLEKLNERWKSENRQELNIGIGINTGEMIVGPVGARKMVSYTVMGDSVNTASRLESLNKEYKTNIIISHSTYEQVKDYVETEYLGEVMVKGKQVAINIYKVTGSKLL
ncbi:MAG: hypothetical protein A2Y25_02480 [Candidatus Melainabacteria bacterium GWF2_37_15]|nr:MAG: hypothetical protein A2Y25_02480 [Candidatus Melainabacteria bacterium GWF2_37_15]